MERLVQHAVASISAQLDHGARAFQLFDSWAGALSKADYDAVRPAPLGGACSPARRPPPGGARHPLRHRLRPPARVDARRRPERARPRLAHADRRRPPRASAPTSSCRATSIRRSCSPVATSPSTAPDAVLADNGGHPGHIFNLGHGVQPNTDPGVLAAVVDACTSHAARPRVTIRDARPTGAVVMAYGTPRTPDEILPYYTDIRRGRPPTDEQLADLTRRYAAIGGISPLAARTEAQRDALHRRSTLGRRRVPRRARAEARRPEDRGGRRRARRRRRRARRRAGARPALLARSRSASTSGG